MILEQLALSRKNILQKVQGFDFIPARFSWPLTKKESMSESRLLTFINQYVVEFL